MNISTPDETNSDPQKSSAEKREVILISSDGEAFTVPRSILSISSLISNITAEEDSDEENESIPLPNVNGRILAQVIEFCSHFVLEKMIDFEKPLQHCDLGTLVQPWYSDFVESKSNNELFELTLAANYLDIRPLLDLCCARIASFIKGKSPEEIRKNLNIEMDFTPEEEAQIRAENAWADDIP